MLEVHGLNELAEIIEENERIKKAEREIRKNKIKELISEGISKEIATAMVDAYIACAL